MNLQRIQSNRVLLGALLLLCWVAIGSAQTTIQTDVKVNFTVALGTLSFNGGPPDAVGLVGDCSPISEILPGTPPVELVRAKDQLTTYTATIAVTQGTRRDLAFYLKFKVDGRWNREPFSFDIPHVAILEPNRAVQNVVLTYDSVFHRIVPQKGGDVLTDAYLDAAAISKEGKDGRAYEYYNAVALLLLGELSDAGTAYDRYCAESPSGLLAKEEYDRFYVIEAQLLAQNGQILDATKLLDSRPPAEGDAIYQADMQICLARLLDENRRGIEARSILRKTMSNLGITDERLSQCNFFIARSYLQEASSDSFTQGRMMMLSIGRNAGTCQRKALLSLAASYRQAGAMAEFRQILEEAAFVGTSEERMGVRIQILDLQFAAADYTGVHADASVILSSKNAGRHVLHLLFLDALALDHLGDREASRKVLNTLWSQDPSSPYSTYAASVLGRPPFESTFVPSPSPVDSLLKGGIEQ